MASINSMTDVYDLHCHSTASDGALSPTEVVNRAHRFGVTSLALTDHDTTAGLAEAQTTAQALGLRLIPGIELSTLWQNQCFHVIGIGINPQHPALAEATQHLHTLRMERAEKIAEKLAKKRIEGALDAIKKIVGNGMITRNHFAEYLLAERHVDSLQEAFDRYLAKGKPAYVATPWTELELAIQWINESGGVAVLAHPLRYQLKKNAMKRLLTAFKHAGGQGIEVITGRSNPEEVKRVLAIAEQYQLAGSTGSDFHAPDQWVELGRLLPMPATITPVWELLRLSH
ncbi:PHP domain-containing protein [Methylocucumis oryzae]|nr:PHP domain-containing protein [Methylocucumis oryzae]